MPMFSERIGVTSCPPPYPCEKGAVIADPDKCDRQAYSSLIEIAEIIQIFEINANTHTHTHPFNGPLSRTTRVSRYQKGKTNLDFTGARDSEWQWHQLGRMQVCISLQTDNLASTSPLELNAKFN